MNIDKFNETISILVKAFLDNTLIHGSCHMCAVGNIVAAKNKIQYVYDGLAFGGWRWKGKNPSWDNVFCCDGDRDSPDFQRISQENYCYEAQEEIDSTGYSIEQLASIELAFELTPFGDDRMFRGLMNVVDQLAIIHGIDLQQKESAKLMFVK